MGSYQPFPRAKTEEECAPCPSGNYCDELALDQPKACLAGFFCPFNSQTFRDTPCPAGTYSQSPSLRSQYECGLCEPGHYCTAVITGTGISSIVAPPEPCDAGSYCPLGSKSPAEDPSCSVDETTEVPGVTCASICPLGAYCEQGSFTPTPCNEGTFTPSEGSDSQADCVTCLAGRFCSGEIIEDTNGIVLYDGTSGICQHGYYCEGGNIRSNGQTSGATTTECSEGTSCGLEATSETDCTAGTYQPNVKGSTCFPCPPGNKCEGTRPTTPVICTSGEYCNSDLTGPDDCNAGTFLDTALLWVGNDWGAAFAMGGITDDECRACPIGKTCGTSRTETPADCDTGFACLGSQITSAQNVNGTSTSCPRGFVCPLGTGDKYTNPCELGTYNPNSEESVSCQSCDGGHVCDKRALSALSNTADATLEAWQRATDCPARYYCPDRACKIVPLNKALTPSDDPADCADRIFECDRGYFCPQNSPDKEQCLPGTYSDRKLLSACFDCEAGYYCPGNDATQLTLLGFASYADCVAEDHSCRIDCPPGHQCQDPGLPEPTECLEGTYNPYSKAEECIPCPAGFFCDTPGMPSVPAGNVISPGWYSYGGASNNEPAEVNGVRGECPDGYTCQNRQNLPEPCPEGSVSDSTTSCAACDEGNYCPRKAVTQTDLSLYVCEDGHQCVSGCTTGNPVGGTDCDACPEGHSCVAGIKTECPAAEYQPNIGQTTCESCPERYQCSGGANKEDCPAGFFCPTGTSDVTAQQCGDDKFNDQVKLRSDDECFPCPPGYECDNAAKDTYPTQLCTAGSYCPGENDVEACSLGEYCPEGMIAPMAVPSGSTSSDQETLISCNEGRFCLENQNNACTVSHYCPAGTQFEIPCGRDDAQDCAQCSDRKYCPGDGEEYDCVDGFTCPSETKYPSVLCESGKFCIDGETLPCSQTTYQPGTGQTECISCPPGGDCTNDLPDPTPCPAGKYCTDGIVEPCEIGFYRSTNAIAGQIASECYVCPYGYYCPDVDGTIEPVQCTVADRECPAGSTEDGPDACPTGYICVNGLKELCAAGQYPDGGICNNCDATKYCPGDGNIHDCEGGYFCPAGSFTLIPENICPVGSVCPENSSEAGECAAGDKTIEIQQSECIPCETGYYCSAGSVEEECEAGHYCESGTADFNDTPCLAGTFSDRTRLESSDQCQECTAGHFCPGTDTFTEQDCTSACECGAGQTADCTECRLGHECTNGVAISCPAGYFNDDVNSAQCEPCSGGTYTDRAQSTICTNPCADGFFCEAGATQEYPSRTLLDDGADEIFGICPLGNRCTNGERIECDQGEYQDREGQSECVQCPAGYFCDATGLETFENSPCPAGSYCPIGTTSLTIEQCPPGTYRTATNGRNVDDCQYCDPGTMCPGGEDVVPCKEGFYCFVGAKVVDAATDNPEPFDNTVTITVNGDPILTVGVCPTSYYCPEGTAIPRPCTAGHYCPDPGMTEIDDSLLCDAGVFCIASASDPTDITDETRAITCPMGFFCEQGTEVPTMCPAGTYSDVTGLSESGECKDCEEGFYCYQGQTVTDDHSCPDGFYCPIRTGDPYRINGVIDNGLTSVPDYELYCPLGHSCKDGILAVCDNGSYQHQRGQISCEVCPAGYFCEVNPTDGVKSPVRCSQGSYCDEGSFEESQCDVGYYGHAEALMNSDQCAECLVGKFCENPGIGTEPVDECEVNFFCEPGSIDRFGQTPSTDSSNPCEAGSECPAGTSSQIKCPAGFYSKESDLECVICEEDQYCQFSGTSEPADCEPGFTCPNRDTEFDVYGDESNIIQLLVGDSGTADYNSFPCPLYHECPDGTISGMKICDDNFYADDYGTINCLSCPDGFTCQGGQITELCPTGRYCRSGESAFPCPAGTYNPNAGASIDDDCSSVSGADDDCAIENGQCLPCLAGHYCNELTGTTLPTNCQAGYFCNEGSENRQQNDCPEGHYCPTGSARGIACPIGTYNTEKRQDSLDDCLACPEGKYCDKTGLSEDPRVLPTCAAGYYCEAGALSAKPEVILAEPGRIFGYCQEGEFCESQSIRPEPCAIGTYNNLTHQSSCQSCPRGYICGGATDLPEPCPVGSICINGVAEDCPANTFNPSEYGYSVDVHCQPCTPGHTCLLPGDDPIPCAEGSFCVDGIETGCADGTICDEGSDAEVPCGYGKLCNNNIESSCPAGTYCDEGMQSGDELPCPPGSYCLIDSKHPTKCDPGTFSAGDSENDVLACADCVSGYCPEFGSTNDTTYTVADGYFCDGSCGSTATPAECEAGNKCEGGVVTACNDVTEFQPNTGRSTCESCGRGFTCPNVDTRTECVTGTYCKENENIVTDCLSGTFGYYDGADDDETACNDCPPGHMCDQDTLTKADVDTGFFCPEGKVCTGGNSDEASTDECPVGFYCPEMDAVLAETLLTGTPCVIGTFNENAGGIAVDACEICPEYKVSK